MRNEIDGVNERRFHFVLYVSFILLTDIFFKKMKS